MIFLHEDLPHLLGLFLCTIWFLLTIRHGIFKKEFEIYVPGV